MLELRIARAAAAGAVAVLLVACAPGAEAAVTIPPPPASAHRPRPATEVAVLSGGCFWGMQGLFEHVKGVRQVIAGYAGGAASTATYDQVSTGNTGHAESVQIRFDPAKVSYGQLLQVFFSVAHDPTELDRQGPDDGSQYRSVIWYTSPDQARTARAYIAQLTRAHVFAHPIVTQVTAYRGFYPAEGYHQDYLIHHPDALYIVINDQPKIANLRTHLPALYRSTPVRYAAVRAAS